MNVQKIRELAAAVEREDKLISEDPEWQKLLEEHGATIEPFARAVIELLDEIYKDGPIVVGDISP